MGAVVRGVPARPQPSSTDPMIFIPRSQALGHAAPWRSQGETHSASPQNSCLLPNFLLAFLKQRELPSMYNVVAGAGRERFGLSGSCKFPPCVRAHRRLFLARGHAGIDFCGFSEGSNNIQAR